MTANYEDLIRRLRGEYRIPIKDGLGPAGGEEPGNAEGTYFVYDQEGAHALCGSSVVRHYPELSEEDHVYMTNLIREIGAYEKGEGEL